MDIAIKILILLSTCAISKTTPRDREERGVSAERQLLSYLLRHYDPDSRPVNNASDTVVVQFSLKFIQIIDLVEKNQTLVTQVTITEEWEDENLRWSPDMFGGLQFSTIPPNKIWIPDTYIFNSAEKGQEGMTYVGNSRALVRHDGHVTWSLPLIVKSSCAVDVKYFPFDNQRCHIVFGSWLYEKSQMNIVLHKPQAYDLDSYIPNPEFHLAETSLTRRKLTSAEFSVSYFRLTPEFIAKDNAEYPQIVMYLRIRRKPVYYCYTVVAPVLVLCAMMIFTFLLPCDSGDKVGIGLTVFLSLYVLQLAIAENIPESNSLPLISLFMTLVMTLNSISLMFATLVINLKKRGDTKPCPEVPILILRISKLLAKVTLTRKLEFRDFYSTCRAEERYLRKISVRSPSVDLSALYCAQNHGVPLQDVLGEEGREGGAPGTSTTYRRGGTSEGSTQAASPTLASMGRSKTDPLLATTLRIPIPFITRRPSSDQSNSSRQLMATRNRKLEWCFVAEVVDKVLFVLFFIALLVTVLTSLVVVPEMHKND